MSFFRKLNRKQRRQFDKLDKNEQKQVIATEINKAVSDVTKKQIANAFLRGVAWENKLLYEKFVTKWDAAKYNEKRNVGKELVEYIRNHYDKYNKMIPDNKSEVESSEISEEKEEKPEET